MPLNFLNPADYDKVSHGDVLRFDELRTAMQSSDARVEVYNATQDESLVLTHLLSPRQVEFVLAGGLINVYRKKLA